MHFAFRKQLDSSAGLGSVLTWMEKTKCFLIVLQVFALPI